MAKFRTPDAVAVPGGADPTEDATPGRPHAGFRRISAVAGLVFAGLFGAALALLRQVPRLNAPDSVYLGFYSGGASKVLVILGLYLVPFTGIAFIWHMAATRALLAALGWPNRRRPDVPRLIQLVSGVLFVCMLCVSAAAVAAVALLGALLVVPLPSAEVARSLAATGYGLVFVFGVRFAGMYMITTSSLARAVGLIPRWVAVVGYLAAAFLLLSTTFHPVILLVFPAWTVLLSGVLLLHRSPGVPVNQEPPPQ